jgi:uncharacterized protein YdeI (BOF family)
MKKMYLSVMLALVSAMAMAQDGGGKSVDVNINTNKGGGWYTNPIVWVVGAAVFILLLVALSRGRSRD